MAELSTLARPYARAAFEFAANANDLTTWSGQLATAAVVARAANMVKELTSPSLTSSQQEISALYEEFKANREKSVEVEVATAFELDAAIQEKLATALSGKLERDVNVQTVIDKNLLGGVVVRAADVVIDGSVRGRLNKLAEAMNS